VERDIVFFLGAGFSADAGLPTMENFGEASESELTALRKLDRYATPLLRTAGVHFEAFREHCSEYLRKTSSTTNAHTQKIGNLETLFCIAEILLEAEWSRRVIEGEDGKFANCVDTWKEDGKMRRVLEEHISRHKP